MALSPANSYTGPGSVQPLSATTPGSLVRPETGQDLAASIRILVVAMLMSSSIVMFEPAPCDLLFGALLPLAIWHGYSLIPRRMPFRFYLAIYLFIFANLVSLFFVDDIVGSIAFLGTTVYLIVFFLLIADIVGRHGKTAADLMLTAFVIAAVIAAAIGILTHFRWIPYPELFLRDEFGMRVKSTFKDPNVFAPFLVAATLIMLGKMLEATRVTVTQVLILCLLVAGILLAFSRGAYVHLLVSLVVFGTVHLLIIRERQAVSRLLASGSLLLLVGVPVLVWLLIASGLIDFFFARLSIQDYDEDRFGTQAIALSIAMDWPFGIGPGQFTGARFGHAAHSLYMRVFVENGLLGLIGLVLFVGSWISFCFTRIMYRGANCGVYLVCLSVVIGILVESAIVDTLHWRHAFLILAIPVGISMYEEQ